MGSQYEDFWTHESYAFVGHSAKRNFPRLSYTKLKARGKKVFAVDPSAETIEGDRAYPDFASLPEPVEAAVLEPPREETADWVGKAADAGIRDVWIHMGRDTPEALAVAKERGVHLLTGTCAVMYVEQGFSYHSVHRWINKLIRKY